MRVFLLESKRSFDVGSVRSTKVLQTRRPLVAAPSNKAGGEHGAASELRDSEPQLTTTPASHTSYDLLLPSTSSSHPTLLMSSLRLLRWDRTPRARGARRVATRAVDCVQPRWKSECAARLAAVDCVQRSRRNSSRFGLRSGPAASCRTDTGPMAGRGRCAGQAAA